MDSMRSLNTSLPKSPKRTSAQPPELLQAFKTAALSVTNLYKTAATNEARARQYGYQEALDDILAFLDKEKLGLGDGEGWKVRRWATERLDGNITAAAAGSESDDDGRGETEKRARSSSPVVQEKANHETLRQRQHTMASTSPVRVTSAPPGPQSIDPLQTSVPTSTSPSEIFSFRSAHPYPQDTEMASTDSSITTPLSQTGIQNITPAPTPTPASVRLEVLPRGSRTPHRNITHAGRHNTRNTTAMTRRSLGSGAGSKRRFDFNDYFDLGGMGDGRDSPSGGGGSKKGRLG
ncbi:MAG: hypothetical protein LQ344_004942 [Seirophora lacunosa]|nr:MAG: hypothetical protein LQ344_004942 [Seirophora lacunosa]